MNSELLFARKYRRTTALIFVFLLCIFSACEKDTHDAEAQARIDEELISKFIVDKNIPAQRHSSGIYYQILIPGSGNVTYATGTIVSARYTGRYLNGTVFDSSTTKAVPFPLGQVIGGWQLGIPLIQKGGKIRLLIPSGLAYGPDGYLSIPPNAVLDFDIELVDVSN